MKHQQRPRGEAAAKPSSEPQRPPQRPSPARPGAEAQFKRRLATEKPVAKVDVPRQRRALSHVGGAVSCVGPAQGLYAQVRQALEVDSDEAAVRAHVHGFHSYPARLHPGTARRAIAAFSEPGALVLDPFCGSGTVLVEAGILGRRAVGFDINPVAVELARFKTEISTEASRKLWLEAAERVADHADERRRAKAGPTRKYADYEREPYDPHMLFELDGLSAGIAEEPPAEQRVLRLILSSILTKVSKSLGDSSTRTAPRRLASGFAIRTFRRKAEEVTRQFAEYAELAKISTRPRVILGDARKLTGLESESVDLVLTSPPYPGVFDYLQHHAARLRWLNLDAKRLATSEIGSRRQLSRLPPEAAVERWEADMLGCLRALNRTLKPAGRAALVIADAAVGNVPIYTDAAIGRLAPEAGLDVLVVGSQTRPNFHEGSAMAFGKPRREHLVLLENRGFR